MSNLEAMWLLQRIVRSSEPPAIGTTIVLSAYDEGPDEERARCLWSCGLSHPQLWPVAANTYEEAQYVLAMVTKYTIRESADLIIVTSAYHQLRAFLTFVKVFQGTGARLWNAPAPSPWDKLEQELEKITEYQAKGHVASYQEGLEHLAWRDTYNCA